MLKKDSLKLEKKFQEFLAAKGATEKPYAGSYEYTLVTPYGPVEITFHHSYQRGGVPWIACLLRGWIVWDRAQTAAGVSYATLRTLGAGGWFGWRHWKQNLNFVNGYSIDEMLDQAKRHIENFYRDQGKGFPENEIVAESVDAAFVS